MASPDLTACDREPIHVPGAIQPHGCLLVVEPATAAVIQAAGDTRRLIGAEPDSILGRSVQEVLGRSPCDLLGRLPHGPPGEPVHLGCVTPPPAGAQLDLLAHERDGCLILELEPAPQERVTAAGVLASVRAAAAALGLYRNLYRLCDVAAHEVRALVGFDRVMVYRFLADGSGTVVADARPAGWSSLLDHRYPASDIPQQARELYRRNLIRLIPDVAYRPAPLVPALCPLTGRPLDMSDCTLRSVSPVHVEYLTNMGVAASMSVSLVCDGRLWGLIACHHAGPRYLPYELREACKHIGQILAQQIAAREDAERHAERLRLRTAQDEFVNLVRGAASIEAALAGHGDELQAAIPSDGVAVVHGEEVAASGRTPSPVQIMALVRWLLGRDLSRPYATDSLKQAHAAAAAFQTVASGLLAVVVSRGEPLLVLWFRAEQVETVRWAGDPHKPVQADAETGVLRPRRSFALWRETVCGRSRAWSDAEIAAARRLCHSVLDLRRQEELRALNARLRRSLAEQEELVAQKDLLMREVNHRVQNSIQLVSSLLHLDGLDAAEPAVRTRFEEAQRRLRAVAMVHQRLWRSDQIGAVDLDGYLCGLRDELVASWGRQWEPHVHVHAPPMQVPTGTAVSLGLAITELMTNAVKYAYGGGVGPVAIDAAEDDGGMLAIAVADRGIGMAAGQPEGFGSRLTRLLVAQAGGRLEIADHRPGTRVVIRIPVDGDGWRRMDRRDQLP